MRTSKLRPVSSNFARSFINGTTLFRCLVFIAVFFLQGHTAFGQREDDPDMPKKGNSVMSKEEFMMLRAEAIAEHRGIEKNKPFDPSIRQEAVKQMQLQRARLATSTNANKHTLLSTTWTEIGPNPIPNGQVVTGSQLPVSGRTISIAVHPTNPDIVYVGTAQGGLYRSTNGGTTWVPLMDNAKSLAIGSIAISPSQPETIYVGTGEQSFSADSYFGVGIYRIDNASSASPTITGPLNKDAVSADVFTGRAIGQILVHPTNPDIIFVASTSGIGGMGATTPATLPSRGIYRSVNATSASPVFTKLTGLEAGGNFSVRDMILDPLNPNLLVCNLIANGGGIYVSNDALGATPTFTKRVTFSSTSTSALTAEFAIQHTAGNPNPVIYAATGNGGGRVLICTDGGVTWRQKIVNNFCGGQCFYDIAIAVDPNDAAKVYLGGTGTNTTFTRSTDSAASFASSASGLHTDSHVITLAPSLTSTIYFGSDGGIYKSTNTGGTWSSLNNSTFKATQFMGLAVHPADPKFTIGGTQDNGTEYQNSAGVWTRADFGDGGFSAIDQNATNTTNVTMYHTYFNQTNNLIGFARNNTTTCATEGQWSFKGIYGGSVDPTIHCDGSTDVFNGISISDAVLFYAPLTLGPGNPNTVYFGTSKLYRSVNKGDVMTLASQNLTNPISAIGISPQDDNVRIVGQNNGGLFGITTGATTLINLDPSNVVPNVFVGRAVIDPNNVNTAYVTLSAFGVQNVWKTTNLNNLPGAAPTWTAVSNGIPQVPVNAFIVDPANSNYLYAGTDIGVYFSMDGGANWAPFGTGLPVVAVFDMAKTSGNLLRIATHGRGMWEINMFTPCVDNTITLTSASGTDAQTVCANAPITNITYATTGATGATVTGLPTGVTGNWAANVVTISGTPTVSGPFNYTVTLTGGCGATITANGSITVTAPPVVSITGASAICAACPAGPGTIVYTAVLSGSAESPSNSSAGTGTATVTINTVANTMRVQCNFSGLTGNVTASHIHASTAVANTGTAGVATTTPTFPGFPLGVTSGSYDNTFDMTLASSYNAAYVTANGGTPASAFAALQAGLAANKAYYNIHSSTFGGGEIRGFLSSSCSSANSSTTLSPSSGGTWISNNPGVATVTNAGVVNGVSPGSATFTFTSSSTNCSATTDAVTVNPSNTVTAASSTPTVCINTPITNITHTTTGATGIGTAIGLPSGVTAAWASDIITISGSPTVLGVFNYTIPLSGGCGGITARGTITVNPTNTISLTSATGTDAQTVCANAPITNITYATTGATGATVTGLPTGVTGNWASNVVTISGIPTVSGPFSYTVTLTGGCGTVTANGSINVTAPPVVGITGASAICAACPSGPGTIVYTAVLSGSAESPSNSSAGTGTATVTINTVANTMRVQCNFSGLTGNVTASHIHASTAVANTGTAGVATTTPTFTGFPSGVTSGSYDNTFDMTLSSSYNAAYVTANGGTTASAFAALQAGLAADKAYLNIHSSVFPGGEIRGFLSPSCATTLSPSSGGTWISNNPGVASVSNAGVVNGVSPGSATFTFTNSTTNCSATTAAVTVNPANTITLTSAAGTNNQPVAINTPITNITYSTTGATGATVTGLPANVTGNWVANVVTISGTPTVSGIFNYTVTLTGGCGTVTASGTINVTTSTCPSVTNRLYVDASTAPGGNGSSWACALNELSTAVAMANSNMAIKSIWVADGTYKPTTGTSRGATMTITRADLKILGGFSGSETLATDANPAANPTIISGDIGTINDMSDNSFHLFDIHMIPASGSPLIIDGFTLEKANATDQGAAVYSWVINAATTVAFNRCKFMNNNVTGSGAAVSMNSGSINFDSCVFRANTASAVGGAIYSVFSSPVVTNSVFVANTAASGGAVYGNYGYTKFGKTVFTANGAGTGGGGAVYQNRMEADYFNCVFNANTSNAAGGALYQHNASISHIKNSTFFRNAANTIGGAIQLIEANSSTITENSIFFRNTANSDATAPGSDIANSTAGANVYANNILQLNTAVPADNAGTIRNNTRGTDPLFANEANPIGPDSKWATADDGLALSNTSPAINTGDNALVPAGTDIINNPRIVGVVDKGAYELPCTPVGITSATAADNPICPTATTTLTANGVTGSGALVTWWTGPGGTGTNLGTGTTLTNATVGTYYARVTGNCGTPAEATVTVNAVGAPTCTAVTNRLYVDANNCAPGNGSSWACAINDLSTAVAMANSNMAIKSIWVADGTYKPTTGTNRGATMTITRADLKILGGFAGGEALATDANPAANPTIISGDIGTINDMSDNSFHLFDIHMIPASGSPLVIDGFTLEKANAVDQGAAVYSWVINPATTVAFNRCKFMNNHVTGNGAAVSMNSGSINFDACVFRSNTATGAGGAIYTFQSSPVISNTVFAANTAANGAAYYGNYGYPKFSKTVFTGNGAGTNGGAVFQNRMEADYFNCVFNANTSLAGGGALYVHSGSISHIKNSTFFKNAASTYGGAIVLVEAGSTAITENSIFHKNMANGQDDIPGSDITNLTTGANVYANNMLQINTEVPADNAGAIRNNIRGANPLFANETNPIGADNIWATNDDGLGLSAGSPAVNTGDNALAPAGTDIAGNPRMISTVDRGAYELPLPICGSCDAAASGQMLVADFTKIKDLDNIAGIVANPFTSELQIRYTGAEIAGVQVSSVSGKLMYNKSNIPQGITKVNSATWSKGVYQVIITTTSGKRMNFKVVRL